MRIAIMQPYLFSYIGYFQLINVVDKFVFYDDVNWINRGYINRNNILLNERPYSFSISCRNLSQNKLIKDIFVDEDLRKRTKFLKTLKIAYKKAPFFAEIMLIIEKVILSNNQISEMAMQSCIEIMNYLELDFKFTRSSQDYSINIGLGKTDRLIDICKKENAQHYINAIGGQELYKKEDFNSQGIELSFLKTKSYQYKQYNNEFVSNLSIIDTLMFNDKQEIKNLLNNYTLI